MLILLSFSIAANIFLLYIFSQKVKLQQQKIHLLEQDNNDLRNFKGRYEQLVEESSRIHNEKSLLGKQISDLSRQILEFEKHHELLKQNLQLLEKEKNEWEKTRKTNLAELAEELIKKNHEQQSKLAALGQENITKTTSDLLKNFENVIVKVKNLESESAKTNDLAQQVKSALLTPKAAGDISELTLANILKASNLKEKKSLSDAGDYILQSHFASSNQEGKRPDAILFLPDNNIVVIDSKSSSHFIDLFEAKKNNDDITIKNIETKLKEAMRRHADSLKNREYDKFLQNELRLNNLNDYKIFTIMFLQTERMLEIIDEIDSSFVQKNLENGIVVASPIGIVNLLNQTKFVIGSIKQQENIAELKIAIEKLLDNITLIARDTQELGRTLNKGLTTYNKISNRFNKAVFNAVRNIGEMGIIGKKSDELKLLENYELDNVENS